MLKFHGQMSESMAVGILLCVSGGFQDAYTYNCRGKVFANAQTGNLVLMGQNAVSGQWIAAVRYLIPVLAFVLGIYVAEKVKKKYKECEKLHWRQMILLAEMCILFLVGWLPLNTAMAANILVSFVCALQVESFRKIHGNACATTMCIGNLRTATELFCNYRFSKGKDRGLLFKSLQYYSFILIFIAGAGLGGYLTAVFAQRAIWFCCLILTAALVLMFSKENLQR